MWKKIYYYLGNANNFTSYYHCHEDGQIIPCPNFYDDETKIKCQCGKKFEGGYTETIKIQDHWYKEVLCGKYLIHHDLTSIKHIHADGTSHITCVNKKKQHECCDCQKIFDETIDPTKYKKKKLPVNGEIKYYLLKYADLWIFDQENNKYFFLDNGKEEILEAIKNSASEKDLICPDNGREKDNSDLIFTIKSFAEIDDIFSQVKQLREKIDENSSKKNHNSTSTQPLQFGFEEIFINLKEQEKDKNIPSIPKKPKRKKKKNSTTPWQGEKIDPVEQSSTTNDDENKEVYICSDESKSNNQTIKNEVISLDENLEEINDEEEKTFNDTADYQVEELDNSSINEEVLAKNVAKIAKEELKIFLKVTKKRFEKKFDQTQNHMSNYSLSIMDNLENNETKTIEKIQEEKNSALKKIVNIAQEKEKSIGKEQEMSQQAFSEHLKMKMEEINKTISQEKAEIADQHEKNIKVYSKKLKKAVPELKKASRNSARNALKFISVLAIVGIIVALILSGILFYRYEDKEQSWDKQYNSWLTELQNATHKQKKIQKSLNTNLMQAEYFRRSLKKQQEKINRLNQDLLTKTKEFKNLVNEAKKLKINNFKDRQNLQRKIRNLQKQYEDVLAQQYLSVACQQKPVNQQKMIKLEKEISQLKKSKIVKSVNHDHLRILQQEISGLKKQYQKISKEINEIFTISKDLQKPAKKKAIKKTQPKKKKIVKPAKKSPLILEIRDKNGKVLQKETF